MTRAALAYSPPPPGPLAIVYQDDFLLAIDKPAGLLTVPGRGPEKADCLATRIQDIFPEARVVHRLDMETSGLVIFARDADTQRSLGRLFESRQVQKTYLAIVVGRPDADSGEINAPLIVDWPNRPLQKIDFEIGKPSCTRYQVTDFYAEQNQSRLLLRPLTGRSHQIRVHLQSIGHPIVGDTLYGQPASLTNGGRLLLHAESLQFIHPATSQAFSLSIPTPF